MATTNRTTFATLLPVQQPLPTVHLSPCQTTASRCLCQNIPKTADHAPSRTFYTWYVDTQHVHERLVALLYKTAYNLLVRLSST